MTKAEAKAALAAVIREIDRRLMDWGDWRLKQAQMPGIRCDRLGRLLGEFAEATRRFGKVAYNDKAFAALIRGVGRRPESQEDDAQEWAIQGAMDAMPVYMGEIKTVLEIEYLSFGNPPQKAKAAGVSLATYCSHRKQGQLWINGYLRGCDK